VMQEVHLLLSQHGRTLCKRGVPLCSACPLRAGCAHARRERMSPAGRSPKFSSSTGPRALGRSGTQRP
jgi:adenine-specific DNA glycosylase